MNTTQFIPIDCKVEVRKRILIASPSRWKERGRRVLVYSPADVPKEASLVPVKRCFRDGDEAVCLMPKGDIEKDFRKIYQKLQISTEKLFVDAHGTAIVDGRNDGVEYSQGDPFWIHVGTETQGYKASQMVPVINLRTLEEGKVRADHVCWYPKLRGPNGEFWTPGGEVRCQRLTGAKNFMYWSFVICQKLDGAPPTVDVVKIRYNDSVADQRTVFKELHKRLLERSIGNASSAEAHRSRRSTSPSPSIISEPCAAILPSPAPVDLTEQKQSPTIHIEKLPTRKRIRAPLGEIKPAPHARRTYAKQSPTLGRIQRRTSSHQQRHTQRRSHDTDGDSGDKTTPSDGSWFVSPSPKGNSANTTTTDGGPEMSTHNENEGEGYCIKVVMGVARTAWDKRFPNNSGPTNDNFLGHDLDSIRECWERERQDPNGRVESIRQSRNASLCNLQDPNCKYSSQYTFKHYHSPANECRMGPTHDHCVSRLHPLPGKQGDCLFLLKAFPRHRTCCYLGPSSLPPALVEFDRRKEKEALEKGIAVYKWSIDGALNEVTCSVEEVEDFESMDEVTVGGNDVVNTIPEWQNWSVFGLES